MNNRFNFLMWSKLAIKILLVCIGGIALGYVMCHYFEYVLAAIFILPGLATFIAGALKNGGKF